jgi:type III pantothenate kinase
VSLSDWSLLVDVGNTRLKWAAGIPGEGLQQTGTVTHGGKMPRQLLSEWEQLGRPASVMVANVGGRNLLEQLRASVYDLWKLPVTTVIATDEFHGLHNCYHHPERLGVDRWLAMIAARTLCSASFCVVDAGTALTIDLVDVSGRHAGGMILPGLAMMMQSLKSGTASPSYDEMLTGKQLGCSTTEAMRLGCLHAQAGAIERILSTVASDDCELLMTGGDARLVGSAVHCPHRTIEHLVLLGLLEMTATN